LLCTVVNKVCGKVCVNSQAISTHTNLRGAGGEELSDEGYCPEALNFLLVVLVNLPEFRIKTNFQKKVSALDYYYTKAP
jgi:hypothetical protein